MLAACGRCVEDYAAELAGPLTTFADQLQTIAQFYLAGQNNQNPEQAARLADTDKTTKQLVELCK